MKVVPDEFIDFLRSAPVSSGVCCCGSQGPECADHQFVDQWDWSLTRWIVEIDQPTHLRIFTQEAYKLIGEAELWGVERETVVIYQDVKGKLWVFPKKDSDERFEKL